MDHQITGERGGVCPPVVRNRRNLLSQPKKVYVCGNLWPSLSRFVAM